LLEYSDNDPVMAALEYLPNNKTVDKKEQRMSRTKNSIAMFLFDVPEPAAQTAALQLLRSKFALDKSFGLCLGLVGLTILEEMV
jgi:hypothetical protein